MESQQFAFHKGFLWGAATSAHQVEGGNHNDWTEWEKKGHPISGRACDHYNRFREDFDIAKLLGHNAHRFSIEWSRIEPEEGKFDEKEIEHYREVIAALRERGMEPFVTLWHYTLPIWFAKRGGWLCSDAVDIFARFVQRVGAEYKNDVNFWVTENEPETFARHGYLVGSRPPQGKNIFKAYRVLKNLCVAHAAAYQTLKNINRDSQIGFSETLVYFEPYNRLPHNLLAIKLIRWWRNNPFFDQFVAHSDFIGLQYYFHSRIRLNPFVSKWGFQYNENKEISDMGWEIYPEGIYHVLKDLKKYQKPIYITENGVADARDIHREKFIREHVRWTAKAMQEGADARGYFYWSLLDNFEWDKGFEPRFGLVEMNYETMERAIRPSAFGYRDIIRQLFII